MPWTLRISCIWAILAFFGGPPAVAQLPKQAVAAASAQQESANKAESTASIPTIESKLAEARTNLAAIEAGGDALLTNGPAGISLQEIATRRILLLRLVSLYEQQLNNQREFESVRGRRDEAARAAQEWKRFPESPPYSILMADHLREEKQIEELRNVSAANALSTLEQLQTENRNGLRQSEEKIRQINERLEGAKEPALAARLSWQRGLERLRSQTAAAGMGVLDSERLLQQEVLNESRRRLTLLQRQLLMAEADTHFTQADFDQVLARIEKERLELVQKAAEAQSFHNAAVEALAKAREDLRLAQANPEAANASKDLATETLAAREADLETADTRLRVLRLMLESQGIERTMWEMRFAGYNSRNVETLADSERRLAAFDRRLSLWQEYQQRQLDSSPSQLELLQARIRDLEPDSPLLAPARARLAAMNERDESILRLLRRIDQVQRLSQRWQEGLERAEHRLPFLGRVQNVFSGAGSFLNRLWTFELFTVEDTITVEGQKVTGKRSVTLSKIVMAIVILAVGVWLSQFLSRLMQPVIVRRFKIEVNQANLIRRWVHAFTVVCIVMFSLVSVKIPLTVFAFAGGALAIGLGFGTQTLLKNFVSGLILLFERPFRIGDVLEVDKQRGVVTEIGLRSSVLQLWDGTETLIPNSSLLENPVSNWTYSSRKVRFTIIVGAAYGSDTRRVIQLLLEVADRHGVVEKEPAPQAFMTDFADSALLFELRYWVNVINANASQVASDLRQMILGSFTESGIVIAFPQRDLHLDATRPIPIEIIPPRAAELPSEPASTPPKETPAIKP